METINEGNCLKEGKCHCNCKISHCFIIDETLPINVFCGVVAGVVGSVISNPTDVLKVSQPDAPPPLPTLLPWVQVPLRDNYSPSMMKNSNRVTCQI